MPGSPGVGISPAIWGTPSAHRAGVLFGRCPWQRVSSLSTNRRISSGGRALETAGNGLRDMGITWMASGTNPTYFCIPTTLSDVYFGDWSSKHTGMIVNFVMGDGSVRAIKSTGRDEASGGYPHNPLSAAERAFWAVSGYTDGDTAKADGVTN